jgi:hypothetical protein
VTEPAIDLTHSILALVGDFLRKLPADQYTALVAGDARLAVVPKGARVTGGTGGASKASAGRAAAPAALPMRASTCSRGAASAPVVVSVRPLWIGSGRRFARP